MPYIGLPIRTSKNISFKALISTDNKLKKGRVSRTSTLCPFVSGLLLASTGSILEEAGGNHPGSIFLSILPIDHLHGSLGADRCVFTSRWGLIVSETGQPNQSDSSLAPGVHSNWLWCGVGGSSLDIHPSTMWNGYFVYVVLRTPYSAGVFYNWP